jgi:hypothetical protein
MTSPLIPKRALVTILILGCNATAYELGTTTSSEHKHNLYSFLSKFMQTTVSRLLDT